MWWSVEFVFRNVDGTGIFSVLVYPMFLDYVSLYVDVLGWDGVMGLRLLLLFVVSCFLAGDANGKLTFVCTYRSMLRCVLCR